MITNEDVLTITQNVLGTMLELAPTAECKSADGAIDERAFTGCVHISGQWQGAVLVQATPRLSRLFAVKFFDLPSDEVSENDIRDAVSELTNMIGGNIKGLVPALSCLSIPSVTIGANCDSLVPGTEVINEVSAVCNGEALRLSLHQCKN